MTCKKRKRQGGSNMASDAHHVNRQSLPHAPQTPHPQFPQMIVTTATSFAVAPARNKCTHHAVALELGIRLQNSIRSRVVTRRVHGIRARLIEGRLHLLALSPLLTRAAGGSRERERGRRRTHRKPHISRLNACDGNHIYCLRESSSQLLGREGKMNQSLRYQTDSRSAGTRVKCLTEKFKCLATKPSHLYSSGRPSSAPQRARATRASRRSAPHPVCHRRRNGFRWGIGGLLGNCRADGRLWGRTRPRGAPPHVSKWWGWPGFYQSRGAAKLVLLHPPWHLDREGLTQSGRTDWREESCCCFALHIDHAPYSQNKNYVSTMRATSSTRFGWTMIARDTDS